jgi:hypothetical protein
VRQRRTCDYTRCTLPATATLRFGDGLWTVKGNTTKQTLVYYCDQHLELVEDRYVVCDVDRFRRNTALAAALLKGRSTEEIVADAAAIEELAVAAEISPAELEALLDRLGPGGTARELVRMVRRAASLAA